MKKKLVIMVLCFISMIGLGGFLVGFFWFSQEKEVKDEYLERLFAPGVPFESVKVLEDKEGKRFIVVRFKERVKREMVDEYDGLLRSRGVSIYGTYHHGVFSWQKVVTDFAITITRKVPDDPDSVEISESVVLHPKKKEPIGAVSVWWKKIRIAVEKDFGKRWQRVRIYPREEPKFPDAKIGRYPGARLREARTLESGRRLFSYVSKDPVKDIFDFYVERTKEKFKKVHSYSELAAEQLANPKKYAPAMKVFGIKTACQRFPINCYEPIGEIKPVKIDIRRCLDPNLENFIEIEIMEE